MKLKYRIVIVFLSILTTISSIVIFSDNNMLTSISLSNNQNVRIDLFNSGSKENDLHLLNSSDPSTTLSSPNWFVKKTGKGSVLSFSVNNDWNKYKILVEVIGDGNLKIAVRGKDTKIDGKRYPALVDYRGLKINNTELFSKRKTLWHDTPYVTHLSVKNGEKIAIEIDARKHHFRFSDLEKIYHINFRMILATFIISILLYSFLVGMYAKGRNLGGRRSDMLFLVSFFVILILPSMNISTEKQSKTERRLLAYYEPIIYEGKFNMEYGNKVDKWFNDRFWGRSKAIYAYSKLNFTINNYPRNNHAILDKKSHWMFNLAEVISSPLPSKHVEKITEQLNNFANLLKNITNERGRFYLLITPTKSDIYKNEASFYYSSHNLYRKEVIDAIKKKCNFPVIFPYESLLEASSKDYVFFKSDHHWTDYGAFVSYKNLMHEISKDYKNLYCTSLDDFKLIYNNKIRADHDRKFGNGHTTSMLMLSNSNTRKVLSTQYRYFDAKHPVTCDRKNIDRYVFRKFHNDKIKSGKILLCGTSMGENLYPFITQSFRDCLFIRLNLGKVPSKEQFAIKKHYENYIREFNPDIFVLCITAQNAFNLYKLMQD